MSVYVDEMMSVIPNKNWPWPSACHLYADSKEELVKFAISIGLKKSWLQKSRQGILHFDLTQGKRRCALNNGARPVRAREIAEKWLREKGIIK